MKEEHPSNLLPMVTSGLRLVPELYSLAMKGSVTRHTPTRGWERWFGEEGGKEVGEVIAYEFLPGSRGTITYNITTFVMIRVVSNPPRHPGKANMAATSRATSHYFH